MGLGDLKTKVGFLLALKRAGGAIQEGAKMGKAFPVAYGIVTAVAVGFVAKVTAYCPVLESQWKALAVAGLVAGFAAWSLRPKESAGVKATLSALAVALCGALYVKFDSACPGIFQQLPALAMAGASVGVGVYLKSHRQA